MYMWESPQGGQIEFENDLIASTHESLFAHKQIEPFACEYYREEDEPRRARFPEQAYNMARSML